MKKVVILSLHLGYGGVEKSVAALANMLVSKYDVEIVCSYKLYEKPRFPINSKVKISYLIDTDLPIKLQEYNVLFKSFKFKKLFRRLNRDYFKKKKTKQFFDDAFNGFTMFQKRKSTMINYIKNSDADIIISSRDIFDEWLGYYGSKDIVKIGWEHNHFHNNYRYARKIVNSCSKLDYLVLVSKELYEYYSKEMRRYKCRCINIYGVKIKDASLASCSVENSWWGNNDPNKDNPKTLGYTNDDVESYLILNLTKDSDNIVVGDSLSITIDLTKNQNGVESSTSLPDLPVTINNSAISFTISFVSS